MATYLTESELIAFRRDLHAHPELSHHESRTAEQVAAALRAIGYAPSTGIAGHGVVATVEGVHDGPTLLFRADMDALPIQEVAGREYGSCNPGVMHACGHDVHTTVGIGVAAALQQRRDELHGRVRFMFQPAEEASPIAGRAIGAEGMVQAGVLEDPKVEAAFALHVMPLLEVGRVGYTRGPVWAASDLFDIEVHGAMAHGAYPHEGMDPIYAASMIVNALQQIASRNADARDACVVSVCRVVAGTAYNIIPDRALLQGLVRTHDPATRTLALRRLHEIAESVATACGCRAVVKLAMSTAVTANNAVLETFATDVIARAGSAEVVPFRPQMGAEDFASVSTRVPSCYLFLGVRNEARGITHMIHTPGFDVDEAAIGIGVRSMTEVLLAAGRGVRALDLGG